MSECKYCMPDMGFPIAELIDITEDSPLGELNLNCCINYDNNQNDKWDSVALNVSFSTESSRKAMFGELPIKYCPVCGRKLEVTANE